MRGSTCSKNKWLVRNSGGGGRGDVIGMASVVVMKRMARTKSTTFPCQVSETMMQVCAYMCVKGMGMCFYYKEKERQKKVFFKNLRLQFIPARVRHRQI